MEKEVTNVASPFLDKNLICHDGYNQFDIFAARVEIKTYVKLLYEHMMYRDLAARSCPLNDLVEAKECFFSIYDSLSSAIMKIERIFTECSPGDELEREYCHYLRADYFDSLEDLEAYIIKLQQDLYDASMLEDESQFASLLSQANERLKAFANDYLPKVTPKKAD